MPSASLPRAARGAVVLALLIAAVSGLSVRSGPIMLLGVSFAALMSLTGILQRRAWSAYGFGGLLILGSLAILFFSTIGQGTGSVVQSLIGAILYGGIAVIFWLAGQSLIASGANRGSPIPWVILALLFSVPFVVFRPVTISSGDMEKTGLTGDFLLVSRFAAPAPGFHQVFAFRYPLDRNQVLVRRVIGMPGDRLEIVNGVVTRNGTVLKEPYVTHHKATSTSLSIVVPANKYYVLGDARDVSRDSRNWGFVGGSDFLGQPTFIYDSLAPDAADIKPAPPESGNAQMVEPAHPPARRWDRVFRKFE